ncbi:MAG: flagellar M-ring protein FliF C-terminal domain-containing protein, partial [Oscillospiraceae bacterium]
EQVHAIQVLIAASVPKMRPEDVTVIDSLTGLALSSTAADANGGTGQNMAFELMVQKQIEDNVVRLLSKRYGANGVVAVAKVTIDYDKMMTEKKELQPDENGDPFVTHNDGEYNINGVTQAGGLVGENDNTDVPQYGYTDPNGDEGMTNYRYSNDYDYSYIKTQIESGNAKLKRATISVMVDESALTPNRRDELIGLVSGSTDIPTDLITISAFDKAAIDAPEPTPSEEPGLPGFLNLPTWVYIVAGVCLLALIILILVVVVIVKKAKKAKLLAQEEEEERQRVEDEARQQKEIDKYKRSLEDMAKSNVDPKDQAIVDEVRNFAKTNPQITANLLRSWMKEE